MTNEQEQHTTDKSNAEACGCLRLYAGGIAFCPMHLASPVMLKALEAMERLSSGLSNPFGHACNWFDDCVVRVADLRRTALAQARPSVAGQIPEQRNG